MLVLHIVSRETFKKLHSSPFRGRLELALPVVKRRLCVCCISKGKEHKKYEFGAKAAIVMTKTNCIIVGAKGFRNEYAGDTLKGGLARVADIRARAPEKAFCNRGFRG